MSTYILAGAIALVAVAFAPVALNHHEVPSDRSGTVILRNLEVTTPISPASKTYKFAGIDHCQSQFGPTGQGWASHRNWRACPGAGNDDHPYVTEYLHGGPHMYLDVGLETAGGPHDDF